MNVAKGAGGPKAGPPSQSNPKGEGLPVRPQLASTPNIKLLANYFNLTLGEDDLTVYTYTFKVLGSSDQVLRGATAKRIFESALTRLNLRPDRYATDFQQQIVTLDPIDIKAIENKDHKDKGRVELSGSAIRFESDSDLQLGKSVLSSPTSDVIDCLNLITGQWARNQTRIAAIGRHRFFPESNDLFRKSAPKQKYQVHLGKRFETGIVESLSVVQGFFQSVRPAETKLFLNVNSTYGVFRPAGNIGGICDGLRPGQGQVHPTVLAKLHEAISKAIVSYELPKTSNNPSPAKMVRIAGFARIKDKDSRITNHKQALKIQKDFPTSKDASFWFNNGHRTVLEHFKKERRLDIRSDLPLINIGKPTRPEYVPAEHCSLVWGQPITCKVTEIPDLPQDKLNDLHKFTCRGPGDTKNLINLVHEEQNLNLDTNTNQVLSNFGVSIDSGLLKVTGRTLSTPNIVYSGGKPARVSQASWNAAEMHPFKGLVDEKICTWIYLGANSENNAHRDTQEGVAKLREVLLDWCGQGLGLTKPDSDRYIDGISSVRGCLALLKTQGIRLVVVVCRNKLSADNYNALKFFGDIQIGIHTSCILASKFRRKDSNLDASYFANVALKINLKLGGINHVLKEPFALSDKTPELMVVGYDVSHPTGNEKSDAEEGEVKESGDTKGGAKGFDGGSTQTPKKDNVLKDKVKEKSQVGLVISADYQLGQWLSHYWNQRPRQEMTDSTLTEAFVALLEAWKLTNSTENKSSFEVVIYRDGVSESQFDQVLQLEVPNIKEAYKRVFPGKTLRMTLVVAIKRHTTRFFPEGHQGKDRNGNILPGMVVDTGVTQPKYWEFFLAAHAAIVGTTRPTRYVVILDELLKDNYTQSTAADKLEEFTHELSYMFGRATKAVGVCTPAYYADILCTRARAYMSALTNEKRLSAIDNSIAQLNDDEKVRVLAGKIHPDLKNSMYWI